MNTPSHHRMHHSPPGNCNYAGVLIIWDRIFGTFASELPYEESVTNNRPLQRHERVYIYGWAKPLDSFNPLYANICHLVRLMESQRPIIHLSGLISSLFKKRVKGELFIETSVKKVIPDIIQQWKLYRHWDAYWHQLFQLPPSVTYSMMTNNKETSFSPRELDFMLHRSKQDNGYKTKTNAITAIFLFVVTLVVSLFLLEQFDYTFSGNGSLIERVLFISTTFTCFYLLHMIGSIQ
jgi:hypothetical protein